MFFYATNFHQSNPEKKKNTQTAAPIGGSSATTSLLIRKKNTSESSESPRIGHLEGKFGSWRSQLPKRVSRAR